MQKHLIAELFPTIIIIILCMYVCTYVYMYVWHGADEISSDPRRKRLKPR